MRSERLHQARAWETAHRDRVDPALLPRLHLTAGAGWLNDPNGFSRYRGEYHLFYQYYPYDIRWGPMHWGHAKTRDFIRWEYLPCALAPDQPYDEAGCYSGSALELPDGRHLLMYTGVEKLANGEERQTQNLAVGDGLNYEKCPENPVIGPALLPPGGDPRHFRDPKLWTEDGRFCAVAGNLNPHGRGEILRYESDDLLRWRLVCKVAASDADHGGMWECPDLFPLDGKQVLLVSTLGLEARDPAYIDGNTALCLIGSAAPDGSLLREAEQPIDCGLDFYATHTVLTEDGRRVLIAWMQYWGTVDLRPRELPFFGQMTLPRELRVRDGRLFQTPVRELEAYRGAPVRHHAVPVRGSVTFPEVRGRCADLTLTVRPGEGGLRGFTVHAAEGEGCDTVLRYEPETNSLLVDRSRSGFPEGVLNRREFPLRSRGETLRLRLILDRYSLELFVNDGEQAATFMIYSPEEADGLRFEAQGSAVLDLEYYPLRDFPTIS